MRSNTSLYVGVYIWIASLEIRTKILRRIRNYPCSLEIFLWIFVWMSRATPDPQKIAP